MTDWPILVVSLADAVQRRDNVSRQLKALGLPFTFFDAVDGRRGIPAELEKYIDRPGTVKLQGYPMADAEYACALSHQMVYRHIIETGLPGAVVIEDDAIVTYAFRDFYRGRSFEAAPLIQLFYYNGAIWRHRGKTFNGIRMERLSANADMTVGYSISARAAYRMRRASLPLRSRADWPCETTRLIGHYVTIPRLILHPQQTEDQSAIASGRQSVIPPGFDHTYRYAKGWRRLYSAASWRRLIRRPFTRRLEVSFEPTPAETSNIVRVDNL